MLMNLVFVNLSMSNIFKINAVVVISHALRINFAKIYTDSEVVPSMTLLFGRMLSLINIFH